jgi:F0F1-type ATP synthase membrane subunit b/b'
MLDFIIMVWFFTTTYWKYIGNSVNNVSHLVNLFN